MKGDFTRDSFDAAKHYSRVMLQQGRVQLDADWNEQTSILLHYLRTLAEDLIGPHAGPADPKHRGFEIITQAFPKLKLDKKLESVDDERRESLKKAREKGDMIIGPGRYYVAGILVENEAAMLYSEQLGYPFSDDTKVENIKEGNLPMLVYLDVWEREVSHVEDDHIREVALGGPDTCVRTKVMWQVKVKVLEKNGPVNCEAANKELTTARLARSTGKLRARARVNKPSVELCAIPPESRYRGAENQLYRVEIHAGGEGTGSNPATFKWSRENGSVVFPIRTLEGATATLDTFGRDLRLGLSEGDWVEILDDALTVGGAGHLAKVDRLNDDELSVVLIFPDGAQALPTYPAEGVNKHPYLRRWEHAGDLKKFRGALQITEAKAGNNLATDEGWLTLEDGVQIRFSAGGNYRAGDYWLIPARTATGDVDWPHEKAANGNLVPAALSAHGPRHAYAPLHLLPANKDCRCGIKALKCLP